MLLVIPSIELKAGRSALRVQGAAGRTTSGDDPVEMARLWRKENAKSIHVTDIDGALAGRAVNLDVIRQMVRSVDIPLELGGGLRTYAEVVRAFEAGIYRAVIGTMLLDNPDDARRALEAFGPSKVVVAVDVSGYRAQVRGRAEDTGLTPLSVALNARDLGFRRLLYTDIRARENPSGPDIEGIRTLAEGTKLRITVRGGVRNLDQLLTLQELESFGVDSVIIGRALYENRFSCQGLWRLCEAGGFPYTAKV